MAAHRSHLGAPSPPCLPGFVNDPSFRSWPPRHTGFPTDWSAAALASPKNCGVTRPRAGRYNARPKCPRSAAHSRGRRQALGCLWHKQTGRDWEALGGSLCGCHDNSGPTAPVNVAVPRRSPGSLRKLRVLVRLRHDGEQIPSVNVL